LYRFAAKIAVSASEKKAQETKNIKRTTIKRKVDMKFAGN
jgi:hypothetical protein